MASLPERGYDDWEEDCGAGWQVLARKGFCRGLWGMNAWKGRQGTGQYRWVSLPIGTSGMGEWAPGLLEKSGVSWGESWLWVPTRPEVRGGLVKHQRHGGRGAWYCTPWGVCGFAHLQSSCLCCHCLRQSCYLLPALPPASAAKTPHPPSVLFPPFCVCLWQVALRFSFVGKVFAREKGTERVTPSHKAHVRFCLARAWRSPFLHPVSSELDEWRNLILQLRFSVKPCPLVH